MSVEVDDKAENGVQINDNFEKYLQTNIVPLVDEDRRIKEKYRGRFWAYFWSVGFFMCINSLFTMFSALMHHHPFDWQLLLLINICAVFIIFIPVFSYYRRKRKDVFDVFLRFYGNWHHGQNKQVNLVHSPIIPKHDFVNSSHDVESVYNGINVEIRDTIYASICGIKSVNFRKVVSSGVILYITFPEKFKKQVLIFEKSGFMKKSKFRDMTSRTHMIHVPAANYFNIFCTDDDYIRALLRSSFFENILDLKETFRAKHVYIEMDDNYMRVYFEGSRLYIDNYKLWSRVLENDRFRQLNAEFERTLAFVDVINYLIRNV